MYVFFIHAFDVLGEKIEGESPGVFDEEPVDEYANTLIGDLFKDNKLAPVPNAILSFNVWMYVVHQLYDILRACKRGNENTDSDMKKGLDIAAALWIGADQEGNDIDTGNMLFNLAGQAAAHFSQVSNGQAAANDKFIESLNAIKAAINIGQCQQADQEGAYIGLRIIIRRLIGYMTIPLVQLLIHHVMERATSQTSDFIEMYALSIGPRVEACMPSSFLDMVDLFVREDFNVSEQDDAITLIQSVYSCLEIDCQMIGEYASGQIKACDDSVSSANFTFAGYEIESDTPDARSGARNVRFTKLIVSIIHHISPVDILTYFVVSSRRQESTETFCKYVF